MTDQDSPGDDDIRPYASPACYAHELEPLSAADLIAVLNTLLEGERAGAQGLIDMAKRTADGGLKQLLTDVARDEGRFCVMLRSHIERLGATPTEATGVFYDKLMGRDSLPAQLKLLDRGQSAVVRTIEEVLPRIDDTTLSDDLVEMRDVHLRNIALCAAVSV